jgi:hypothetical protein
MGFQNVKIVRTTRAFVTPFDESRMMPLWRQGFDTLGIARALNLPESEIANRLPRLRERERQMRGGR